MADEDDDLAAILAEAGMDANHPLFARAQAALQAQQETQKLGLVEQLREKSNELKVKRASEWIGIGCCGYGTGFTSSSLFDRLGRSVGRISVWSSTTSSSSLRSCR